VILVMSASIATEARTVPPRVRSKML